MTDATAQLYGPAALPLSRGEPMSHHHRISRCGVVQQWRHHEARAGELLAKNSLDADLREAYSSDVPLRCPRSLIRGGVRRIAGLSTPEGIAALRDGVAFVCPADDLIGDASTPLRKWTPKYLQKHLPQEMKWPVLHHGTSKIIMTHTNRYMKDADLKAMEQGEGTAAATAAPSRRFDRVRRTMMSFEEYTSAARSHEQRVAEGLPSEPPYLGSDLLWRNSMADNGFVQNIGERLKADLLGGANFAKLKHLMDANLLPLMKQVRS